MNERVAVQSSKQLPAHTDKSSSAIPTALPKPVLSRVKPESLQLNTCVTKHPPVEKDIKQDVPRTISNDIRQRLAESPLRRSQIEEHNELAQSCDKGPSKVKAGVQSPLQQRPQMRVTSPDSFSLASLTSSMRRKWGGLGTNIIKTIDKLMEPRTPTSPTVETPPKPLRRLQTARKSQNLDFGAVVEQDNLVAVKTRVVQQAPIMVRNPMADELNFEQEERLESQTSSKDGESGIAAEGLNSPSSVSSQELETASA